MNKSNNRSVQRTKAQIQRAFLKLLSSKTIQEISVKELTESINISRGSFYSHYTDVYDLMNQLENKIIIEFKQMLMQKNPVADNFTLIPILTECIQYLYENSELFNITFRNNSSNLFDQIIKVIHDRFFNNWRQLYPKTPNDKLEIFFTYMIGGIIEIIKNYLLVSTTQNPEEVAKHIESFILFGAESLKYA